MLLAANLAIGSNKFSPDPITPATDASEIQFAADQLVRNQLPDGFFPYDFNFANGKTTPMTSIDGLNLVRQSSAAFALSEYLVQFENIPVQESLILFLEQSSARSLPISKGHVQSLLEWSGFYNRWQIWMSFRPLLNALGLLYETSDNGLLVSVENDYERAWPGTTALALYSALRYYGLSCDSRFNPWIKRWKDGLLALKVPRRGFREAPHYLTESDYVNGEAWLALAYYSKVFPEDAAIKTFLVELEEYLYERYGEGTRLKFFQWGMMAAVVRSKQINDERLGVFIQKLIAGYMKKNSQSEASTYNTCASVEGLASYISYMNQQNRGQELIVEQVRERISSMMKVNRRLQITPDFADRLHDGTEYTEELEKYQGAFVLSLKKPLMQVDLTAHCLNALLRIRTAGLGY